MRRWGHKEGTGLGAKGTGIVHALAAEHVDRPPKSADPNQPLSKRQLAKQKAAAANLKNRKWVQHAHARGKIVNSNDDERAAEEKARSGEASRVVCLRGMVGGLEEVDEDLADEIGEECSKFG
jgi:splicing factor 45